MAEAMWSQPYGELKINLLLNPSLVWRCHLEGKENRNTNFIEETYVNYAIVYIRAPNDIEISKLKQSWPKYLYMANIFLI